MYFKCTCLVFNQHFCQFFVQRTKCQAFYQNFFELNRAVCIDYPNRDVPWFHEKYCQKRAILGNVDAKFL